LYRRRTNPDAEDRLIRPLTRWVLGAQWRRRLGRSESVNVAVNVSARSLHDGRLLEDVEVLLAHDLAPRLVLEVTERGLDRRGRCHAPPAASRWRSTTSAPATRRSASRKLPVHELKIDKSFVMGMKGEGGEDTAIVRSTADLAHNLGMTVVAEGVEDPWTLDQLAMFGCDQAQGYHIARPMPGPAYADWVRASTWRTVES
jgi:EAL domain-containing protein (putative c-di-GMP-specific phosphodiesterase class I)